MRVCRIVVLAGWLCFSVSGFSQAISTTPLELHVKKVVYIHSTQSPVVILVDKPEKRFLPIWIGLNEAQAIALEMYDVDPPRPMTHDLFNSLVKELDAKIEKLVITETKANTYFALLSISSRGKTRDIDCRPSDGIAIALRAKAPILASETVMANALPVPDEAAQGEIRGHRAVELGLTVQPLTPDLVAALEIRDAKGVLVSDSRRKEIRNGDVILAVGGNVVESVEQFTSAVEKAPVKKEIELKVLRNGKTLSVRLLKTASDDSHQKNPH